jgi:hypothetical protein
VDKTRGRQPNEPEDPRSHSVKLPGFLAEEEIGLGDVIKRVTHAIGIAPCGGCERRAEALNRWMRISGK